MDKLKLTQELDDNNLPKAELLKGGASGKLTISPLPAIEQAEYKQSRFDEDKPFDISQEDWAGEQQGRLEKIAYGSARFLAKFGLEVNKGAAYTYALGDALFTDKTLPEALDNSFLQAAEHLEEDVKELLPIFVPKDVREGTLIDNMLSTSFYTSEGADAFGYMASAIFPPAAIGKLGMVTKLASMTKVNPKILSNLSLGALTTYQTATESLAEVSEFVNKTKPQLMEMVKNKQMDIDEANRRLSEGAKNVFWTNASVLAGPNLLMNKWLLGRYFKDSDASKALLNKQTGAFQAPSSFTFKENAKNFLGKAGLGIFSEGFFEEGIQGAASSLNEKLALAGKNPKLVNYIKDLADEYAEKLSTTDQQKAIFLGGLLGSVGAIGGVRNDIKQRNAYGLLAALLEQNRNDFDANVSSILKISPDGKVEVDIDRATEFFQSDMQSRIHDKLLDAAKLSGNKDLYDMLFNKLFTKFVVPFLQYGDGLDTLNDYLDLTSKKYVESMRKVDPTFKQEDEARYIGGLKQKAKDIQKDFTRYTELLDKIQIKDVDQAKLSRVKKEIAFAATNERSFQTYLESQIAKAQERMQSNDPNLMINDEQDPISKAEYKANKKLFDDLTVELNKSKEKLNTIVKKDEIKKALEYLDKVEEDRKAVKEAVDKEIKSINKDRLKTGTAFDGLDLIKAYEQWSNTRDYSPEDVQAFKDQLTSTISRLKSVDPIKLTDEILLDEIQRNKALRSLGTNVLPLLKKELGLATTQVVEDDEFPDLNETSEEETLEETTKPVKSGESKFRGFGEFTTLFDSQDKHRVSRIASLDPNVAKNITKLKVTLNTPSKPTPYNSKVQMVGGKYAVAILHKDNEVIGYLPHSKQFLDMSGKPIDIQNLTEAQFKDLFEPDAKYSLKDFKATHKALENFEAYLDRQGVTTAGMVLAKDWIDKHVRVNVTTGEFNFITKDQPLTRATEFGNRALINGNPFIVELPISKKQNEDGTYVINGYGLPRIFGEGLFEEDGKYPAWLDSSTLKLRDTANAIFKGKNIFTSRYAMLVADSGGVVDINGTMYSWVFLHPNTFENPETFVEELNDTKARLAAMPISDSRMQELKLANEALLDKIFIASNRGTSIQLNLVGSQTTGGIQFSVEFYSEIDSFKDRVYFDSIDSFQDLVAKIEEARKTSTNPNILALEPITERSIRENISSEEFKEVDSDKLKSFLNRLGSVVSKNIKTQQNINISFVDLTPPVQPKQTEEEQAPDDFLEAELAAGEALLAKKLAGQAKPTTNTLETKKLDIERRRPTSYIRDSKDKKSPLETFRNESKREWDGVSVITGDRMKNLYVGIQLFVEAYPEHKDLLDKFIKKENGTIGITNNNLSFVLNTLKKQGVTTESELGSKINAKYDAELAALNNEVIPPKKFNNPMAEFAALQLKAKNKTATREELARMEELQELFTDEDGNFVYKLSKAPAANKLDLDMARDYIASILPSWISVRELDTVMANLGKYGTVFGKFVNDVIYLNKEGAVGTEYHEAFHAVFRVLLNQDEITLYRQLGKTDLISKLKADNITFDKALEEFKYSHPSRVSLSRVDLINLMIEEHLADKFQSWKLNKKNQGVFAKLFDKTLAKLFDKILNFLNWITGTDKRDIESLFNKIDSGYFKEMPKVSNNLVASPVYALVTNGVITDEDGSFRPSYEATDKTEIKLNTIIALTFEKISNNNKEGKKFVDIDNKFQRDKFVNQVFKELAIEYSSTNPKYADRDMYEQAEGLTLQEYLRKEKYTYTNPSSKKALIDMIDYKLSQYKLSGLEDSLGETDNNEVDAERRRDINQEGIGGIASLSAEIRQYIGLTLYKFKDQFGIERTRAVDPKKVYEGLTRGTANSLTELDIVKKLYELKDLGGDQGSEFINKFFNDVSLKANDMETSDFYVSIDETKRALYQKVVKAFNLYSLDHLTVGIKFSGNGAETTTSLANKKNVEYNQRVQWAQEFISFIEPNFRENTEYRDVVLTRLNSLVSRYLSAQSAPTNKVANERAEELVSAFHDIGISLSKGYVKYLILSNPSIASKINKGQLSTVVTFKDEISSSQVDTVAYFKQIIDLMMKGNNPFERVNEEVDGKTVDLNQDAVTKIEAIAKDNAIFDESVTNVSFQSSEGKTLYGLQQGTFEVTETLRIAKDNGYYDDLKKKPYLSNNYLVTNPLFELIRKNLKIERVEGIYEDVTNTKTANKQEGVVYGSMKPRDLMLFQLGSAIDYKTESFLNKDKSVTEVLTAPMLISIMETSSTADLVRLPVFKDAKSTEGFSDAYINAIFQEVKREYDRIKRVKDGAEDTWVDYTDGRGLDFWIMKDLLMTNEGLYNQLKNTEKTPEEVQNEINATIKEYLTKKLDEFYQDLSKLSIIRRNNVGKLVNLLLDPRYEGLATSTNKKIFATNDVELNLANVYLSQYINNISYNQLMIGDPALSVKDDVDYTKRNKFRNGSGSTIYSESFPSTIYIVFEEPVEDGTKVADAQSYGTPRFFKNLFESLGRLDEKSREIYDKLEKGEEDLSYSDVKYLKKRNAMTNSIKITGGDRNVNIKTSTCLLHKRLVGYTNEEGKFVAIPGMENLFAMYNRMVEDSVDISMPKTAMKRAIKKLVSNQTFDSGGKGGVNSIDNNFVRLQMENPSNKTEIKYATQVQSLLPFETTQQNSHLSNEYKKSFTDIMNNNFNLLNEVVRDFQTGEIDLTYFKTIVSEILLSSGASDNLLAFFSPEKDYNLNLPATLTKFRELYTSHFKSAFSLKVPGYKATLQSDWGVNVLCYKDDTNRIVNLNMFHSNPKDYQELYDSGTLVTRRLEERTDKDGITYAECLISTHFAEQFDLKPGDEFPKELMDCFGNRIPASDKHSMTPLRIIGVLPASHGSNLILPAKLIDRIGHDFDVDAFYIHRPAHYVVYSEDGTPVIRKYGNNGTDSMFSQYMKYIFDNQAVMELYKYNLNRVSPDVKLKEIATLYRQILKNKNIKSATQFLGNEQTILQPLLKKHASELLNRYLENVDIDTFMSNATGDLNFEKDSIFLATLRQLKYPTTEAEYTKHVKKHGEINNNVILNNILDLSIKIWSLPEMEILRDTPESDEALKNIAEKIAVYKGKKKYMDLKDKRDPFTMNGLNQANAQNRAGSVAIGAAVNSGQAFTLLNEFAVQLNNAIRFKINGIEHNDFLSTFSRFEDIGGIKRRIMDNHSTNIVGATDSGKTNYPGLLNLDIDSLSVVSSLISRGVPIETAVYIANLDSIKEYMKLTSGASLKTPSELKDRKENVFRNILDRYEKNYLETANKLGVDRKIAEDIDLQKDNIIEGLKGIPEELDKTLAYYDTHVQALKLWNKMSKEAFEIGHLNALIKLNKGLEGTAEFAENLEQHLRGIGYEYIVTNGKVKLVKNEALSSELELDFSSIVNGDPAFRARIEQALQFVYESKEVFIDKTPIFRSMRKIARATMYPRLKNAARVMNEVDRNLMSFLTIQAYKNHLINKGFEEDLKQLSAELVFKQLNDNKYDAVIMLEEYIKKHPKLSKNPLVNSLRRSTRSDVSKLEYNTRSTGNKGFERIMVDSFTEIYRDPELKPLAKVLFNYLIMKDSMQYRNNSYLQLIPPFMFEEMSKSIYKIQGILSKDDFTNEDSQKVFGLTKDQLIGDFYDKHFRYVRSLNQLRNGNITKTISTEANGELDINILSGLQKYVKGDGLPIFTEDTKVSEIEDTREINDDIRENNKKRAAQNFKALSESNLFTIVPITEIIKGKPKTLNRIVMPLYFKRTVVTEESRVLKIYKLTQVDGKPLTYDMLNNDYKLPIGETAKYIEVSTLGNTNADVLPFAMNIQELEKIAKLEISSKIKIRPSQKLADMTDAELLASAPSKILRELDALNVSKTLGTEEFDIPDFSQADDMSDAELDAGLALFDRVTAKSPSKFNPAPSSETDLSNFQKEGDYWVNHATGEKLSNSIYQSVKETQESKKVQQDKKTDC